MADIEETEIEQANAPVIFDPDLKEWVKNPFYTGNGTDTPKYPANTFKDDADTDADPATGNDFVKPEDILTKPPNLTNEQLDNAVPLYDSGGHRVTRPQTGSLPPFPHSGDYGVLRDWTDAPGAGRAFDFKRTIGTLEQNCSGHTGSCLEYVANALYQGGFDVRAAIRHARAEGWTPQINGSYWAKEMIPVLQHDEHFATVATGFGNRFDAATSANYVPKVGDIMVYAGGVTGPYGHIQMCVGFRQNGSAIWESDFQTHDGNMSGMRDPDGHGGQFFIFRQHTVDMAAAPKPDTGPNSTKPGEKPDGGAKADPTAPAAAMQVAKADPAKTEPQKPPVVKSPTPGTA